MFVPVKIHIRYFLPVIKKDVNKYWLGAPNFGREFSEMKSFYKITSILIIMEQDTISLEVLHMTWIIYQANSVFCQHTIKFVYIYNYITAKMRKVLLNVQPMYLRKLNIHTSLTNKLCKIIRCILCVWLNNIATH